ncbi:MAG: hypothetical protein V3V72_13605 [Ignavibacteriaceae bacterium]
MKIPEYALNYLDRMNDILFILSCESMTIKETSLYFGWKYQATKNDIYALMPCEYKEADGFVEFVSNIDWIDDDKYSYRRKVNRKLVLTQKGKDYVKLPDKKLLYYRD